MRQQLRGNAAEICRAYTGVMAQPDSAPLTGYRIAVTSARRAEELCALLGRQGAEVCSAPAINMIALPDDDELHRNSVALIAEPPDILVAHTGIGVRGWLAAAEGWGLANQLIAALSSARIVARGPKATGALRAAGLHEEWSPEIRILTRRAEVSTRIRCIWYAHRHPAARRCRCLGPVPGIYRRIACRGCRSRAHPGVSVEVNTIGRRVRPVGQRDCTTAIRCGQLHIGTRSGRGSGTQPRLAYRGSTAGSTAHRRARDVRGPGNLPTVKPKGRPDVIARANAVGSLGPAYYRAATAAGLVHREGRRPRGRYPRNLRAGRWFDQVAVSVRDGDTACAGATSRRRRRAQ